MTTKQTKYNAKMLLPAGAEKAWTQLMQGENLPPGYDKLDNGQPMVMAHATFEDGTQVLAGVAKGATPEENSAFMWVFDKNGTSYSGWPIDLSDVEGFNLGTHTFGLEPHPDEENYRLTLVELPAKTPAPAAPAAPATPDPAAPAPSKPAAPKKSGTRATKASTRKP